MIIVTPKSDGYTRLPAKCVSLLPRCMKLERFLTDVNPTPVAAWQSERFREILETQCGAGLSKAKHDGHSALSWAIS